MISETVRLVVLWGQTLFAVGLAAVAHELAHATATILLGARLDSVGITHVRYEVSGDAWLTERAISLAPQLLGVAVGVGWIVAAGVPTSLMALPGAAGWVVFVANGGRDDFRFVTDRPTVDRDRWWQWAAWDQVRPADQAATLILVAVLGGVSVAAVTTSQVVVQLGLGVALIAISVPAVAVAGRTVADWEAQIGPSRRAIPDGGEAAGDDADADTHDSERC
jgi:hypothetical protein